MENDPVEVKVGLRTMNSKQQTPNADQKWERFERKFFVSPEKTDFARSLLSHICLRDSKYPQGRINSLYFDTPDLDYFQKSGDGNYEREKIRIRWYDDLSNQQGMVPVYLELKFKRGFASKKRRRKILVPAERLNRIRADNAIISRDIILRTLSEFGYFCEDTSTADYLDRLRTFTLYRSFDWR